MPTRRMGAQTKRSGEAIAWNGSRNRAQGFPHRGVIETAAARTVPGLAVFDRDGCSARGVVAFTERGTSHFASTDVPLHVAAHEAAHIWQHTGGVRDAYLGAEGHAHAVADRIAERRPAADLLGTIGDPVTGDVHNYTEVDTSEQSEGHWKAGAALRVADDGNLAVAEENPVNHRLWAKPELMESSNKTLAANRSVIKLNAGGGTLEGPAPAGGGTRTLSQVIPENQTNGTSGDSMQLWADCGKSCRDVAGAGRGTGHGQMTAEYRDVKQPWYTQIPLLGPLLGLIFGKGKEEQKKTGASQPQGMKEEIFNEKLGGTGDEGQKKYESMSADEKEKFDKETGINKYAKPGVGQGFTMSSGGASAGPMTWNFHWAGVILQSGSDRVTLENYSVSDPAVENAGWQFEMYGPPNKTGQTFYEQHKASGQHGTSPTAMQVEPL